MQRPLIFQTPLKTSKYIDFDLVENKVNCWERGVTASLVLTLPPDSGKDAGEKMSLHHQKTKQGLG